VASQQSEDYLEAIDRLEERGELVTTSALARERGVSAPSVTEMLRRLSEQGLVAYEQRKGVSLTAEGRRLAASVVRRHRLWERFLHDVLGLRWDRVDDEACKLEHATSPEVERRLARALGNVDTCPHGHAIPGAGPETSRESTVPLSELEPARLARIVSVREGEAELLRRLGSLGIRPGAIVRVEDEGDPADSLVLRVANRRQSLERDLASHVAAKPLSPEEAKAEADGPVSISDLVPGEAGVVRELLAGRTFVARCLALGFTPGTQVRMIQNPGHGPVIVLVRDTRVALGRGEAQKIRVVRVVRKEEADVEAS